MVDNELIVVDARAKAQAYDGLAARYLRAGDTFLAVHAQITADIYHAVAMGKVDPLHFERLQFTGEQSIERFISRAALLRWNRLPADASPADIIKWFRKNISYRLPLRQVKLWRQNLSDVQRFLDMPEPDATLASSFAKVRIGERDPHMWVNARFSSADRYAARSKELRSNGSRRQALRAWYASDLASFEAWLVSRSLASGDRLLIQAELRWELAMEAIEQIESLPEDFESARDTVRSRLAWVVGPQSVDDLVKHLNRA